MKPSARKEQARDCGPGLPDLYSRRTGCGALQLPIIALAVAPLAFHALAVLFVRLCRSALRAALLAHASAGRAGLRLHAAIGPVAVGASVGRPLVTGRGCVDVIVALAGPVHFPV